MGASVIVWDIETVPDLKGFAAANGHVGKTDDEVRAELGDKFPKHIYHSIICIGALVAHRADSGGPWIVDVLGAPHIGDRSEREMIASFVEKIAALSPHLVTFNGSSFDFPVLRYRAMVHGVAAPGLAARPYFNRYTDDAIDLLLICAMCCRPSVHKRKQRCTNCVASWAFPASQNFRQARLILSRS
jgi:3'-5' exonuclease